MWIYLDAEHNLVNVEASAHGKLLPMRRDNGTLPLENDRITLYSEPGKHGFVAQPEWFANRRDHAIRSCGENAGEGGVHTSNPFGKVVLGNPTPFNHRLAKGYMQQLAFIPTWEFDTLFDLRDVPFVTWDVLQDWIPRRVKWWFDELERTVPHLKLICLDSGDTLVDEATEVKIDGDVVLRADLIPDASAMIEGLLDEGYRLALVADGPRATFLNVLGKQHDLWEAFESIAISEDVGVLKPNAKMFLTVLDDLNIAKRTIRMW